MRRCSASAAAYAAAPSSCRSLVEPSTSVNKKVTVPEGRSRPMGFMIVHTPREPLSVVTHVRISRSDSAEYGDRFWGQVRAISGRLRDPLIKAAPGEESAPVQRNHHGSGDSTLLLRQL